MGNPNADDEGEEEEMTPEELVLEAAASSALDPNQEKKKKKKKKAGEDEEEDDDEILASVPTELARGDNVQRTTPGAFREGDDDNNDDIRTTASSSHRSESFRQSKLLVEATLVNQPADGTTVPGETNNETPATAANGGEEVYKAEPVTVASTGSGDRRWFWRGILVGTFISILIVGGAIVALVLLAPWDSRDSSSDLKNAATETPAPGPPSKRQRTLDDYDRITDHVAFVGLWVDDDHCEFDDKNSKGEMAQIYLKCGNDNDSSDDDDDDDEDIQKPLLEIRDEGGSDCRPRRDKRDEHDEYICDIFDENERIVFSCGTDAKEYRTGSQNTTAKATASAHLERMKATCDSGGGGGGGGGNGYQGGSGGDRDRNRGRKTGGLRRRARDGSQEGRGPPPIMLAIIAIGRLCHPENPGVSYFNPSGVCLPSASFINESSRVCYNEEHGPCGGSGSGSLCLGEFTAFDSFVGDTNCDSEDVENSFWEKRPGDFEAEIDQISNVLATLLDEEILLDLIRPGLNGTEN